MLPRRDVSVPVLFLHAEKKDVLYHQGTLVENIDFEGVGVHTGRPVRLTIHPADVGTGYRFLRTDVTKDHSIQASYDLVKNTHLCTELMNEQGTTISTVEHLLAALSGAGVTNAFIEVSGPEVPIMDGSSGDFYSCIKAMGVSLQQSLQKVALIKKPISVSSGHSKAFFLPSGEPKATVYFNGYGRMDSLLPQNVFTFSEGEGFDSIAYARTFGFYEDGLKLRERGFAQGASFDNTVVIHEDRVMNPEGLRMVDECLRHKVLDVLGDLSLAGAKIQGHFVGINPGHGLNNLLLRELFKNTEAWEWQ